MKKIELITPQPNIAAPVIKKPNLFPTFVAFNKKVDPANVIIEPMNISIPVTNKLEDKSDLIISRIRCDSSQSAVSLNVILHDFVWDFVVASFDATGEVIVGFGFGPFSNFF